MFDVNLLEILTLLAQVALVLLPTPQPSWTRGALNGSPHSWDQRRTWGHAGDRSGLLEGVRERIETPPP